MQSIYIKFTPTKKWQMDYRAEWGALIRTYTVMWTTCFIWYPDPAGFFQFGSSFTQHYNVTLNFVKNLMKSLPYTSELIIGVRLLFSIEFNK